VQVEAVVTVQVDGEPVCLASRIAPGWYLTAQHCLQRAVAVEVSRLALGSLRIDQRSRFGCDEVHLRRPETTTLAGLAGADLALVHAPRDGAGGTLTLGEEIEAPLFARQVNGLRRVPSTVVESLQAFTRSVTCEGDSGGPLLDGRGRLVGVASWRTPGPCGQGTSVFTRIAPHRAWIESTLQGRRSRRPHSASD